MKVAKYFSATWCGPCKQFKPIMQEVASEGYSVQFIDIDEQIAIAEEYKVRAIPVIVVEENGIVIDRIIGALTKQQILERLM